MATYSFRIKKGKYQLDLSTSDKELLVEQFELWVKQATEYNRKRKAKECKEIVNTQIKAEEEITKKNIEAHIAKHKTNEAPTLEETPKSRTEDKPKKDISNKEKSSEKDLDIFYAPSSQETITSIANKTSGGVFDNILEKSLNVPIKHTINRSNFLD